MRQRSTAEAGGEHLSDKLESGQLVLVHPMNAVCAACNDGSGDSCVSEGLACSKSSDSRLIFLRALLSAHGGRAGVLEQWPRRRLTMHGLSQPGLQSRAPGGLESHHGTPKQGR